MPALITLFFKSKFWRIGFVILFSIVYFFNPTSVAADFLKVICPAEITIEKEFEINLEISAQANTNYSVKARLGKDNQFTYGQTYNKEKGVWLSDSVSWNSFPKFQTDTNGMWVGTVTARTTNKITEGENFLVIRIHAENGSNTDSATYSLKVLANKPAQGSQMEQPITPKIEKIGNPILNEFVPQPQIGTEWVEIFNKGEGEADLSGWFIDDEPGKSAPTPLPAGTIIPSGGFFVLELKSAKLNDITDMVRLLKPDASEVESYRYETTEKGSSWAKDSQGVWFLTAPTPGSQNPNQVTVANSANNTEKISNSQKTEEITTITTTEKANLPQVLGTQDNQNTATVSASFQEKPSKKFFFPVIIFGFFLISVGAILFLRKRLQNQTKVT